MPQKLTVQVTDAHQPERFLEPHSRTATHMRNSLENYVVNS